MTDDPWSEFRAAPEDPWSEFRESQAPQQPPVHADTFWGDLAKKYWPIQQEDLVSRDPQLALRAKIASHNPYPGIFEDKTITPQELNATNEGRAGEYLKGAPVLGANVPQTESMNKFEAEHPTQAAVARGLGAAVGTAPLVAAAPAAFGADAMMPWWARAGAGYATNSGIAAADTKARGGSEWDAAKNSVVPGLIGAAIPGGGAAMRGIQDTASSYPYAGPIIKNMVSRPIVPWYMGGDAAEGAVGYLTGGHSEPYLVALRAINGLIHGVKEARQGVPAAPTVTIPTQQQLLRSTLTPQAISAALTQQNQPSQ